MSNFGDNTFSENHIFQLHTIDAVEIMHDRIPELLRHKLIQRHKYVQTKIGYAVCKWLPWIRYELLDSDAANGTRSCRAAQLGFTYQLKGHNTEFKIRLEQLEADQPLSGNEDSMSALMAKLHPTY